MSGFAREIRDTKDRNYPKEARVVYGTADLIMRDPLSATRNRWVVADYKTGTYVEGVDDNAQLLFFATCIWRMYPNLKHVEVQIIFVDQGTGRHTITTAIHSAERLNRYLGELREMEEGIRRARERVDSGRSVRTTPGDWCKYCPSFSLCPGQRHLSHALVNDPGAAIGLTPGAVFAMTPMEAGDAWMKLKRIKQLTQQLDKELRAYAADTGLVLPDGSTVRLREYKRSTLAGEVARGVLRDLYGNTVAEAAETVKISKASMRRALEPVAKAQGTSTAKVLAHTLEVITDRGGIRTDPYQRLLHKPRED